MKKGGTSWKVAVIIPVLNEEEALPLVLRELPSSLVSQVIVVDNGSTDRTADVATQAGARVVSEPRRGYGRACQAGLTALEPGTDVVVFLDGDHSDFPEDLPALVAPIREGNADLVIGSRILGHAPQEALFPQQRFGNWLTCWLIRWFYGARFTDLGPFRAIRVEVLKRLHLADPTFGWNIEMQLQAVRWGLRVVEVPVRYRPRAVGRSKISGTLTGTMRAGAKILAVVFKNVWLDWRLRGGCFGARRFR
ncbi:MAG: glycosyltransferase family 2 protein [Elusimicrobia bacterium]|nr:glycosyltransferase family 2 protein [Elusimicrobiota bacterium]